MRKLVFIIFAIVAQSCTTDTYYRPSEVRSYGLSHGYSHKVNEDGSIVLEFKYPRHMNFEEANVYFKRRATEICGGPYEKKNIAHVSFFHAPQRAPGKMAAGIVKCLTSV